MRKGVRQSWEKWKKKKKVVLDRVLLRSRTAAADVGCFLVDSWLFPGYFLAYSWLFPDCFLPVSWLFPGYFLVISWLFPGFFLSFPVCFLVVSWLFPGCFQAVSWLFSGCFLAVSCMQDHAGELDPQAEGGTHYYYHTVPFDTDCSRTLSNFP